MVYKINFKDSLKSASLLLIHTISMVPAYILVFPKDDLGSVLILLGCFFLLIFPGILIHIEYHRSGSGSTISVQDDSLKVEKENVVRVWMKSEIRLIQLFKGASTDAGGMPLSGIEHYYFARFWFKEGEYVDITCLQCRDIYAMLALFDGITKERKKVLFNSLYLNTIFHTPDPQIFDA